MKKRYLTNRVIQDLSEKMVFIGGPRQVGKTTLADYIAHRHFKSFQYLNWDARQDRKDIVANRFKGDAEILVFDEIHKYKGWKNYLKGLYDKNRHRYKILVTGSARLDIYRKGGDSLMGRYHHYRLHPFTVAEFLDRNNLLEPFHDIPCSETDNATKQAVKLLMKFGGFPEPLLKQEEKTLRRWHNNRADRLVREDIRDLQNIRDISSLQLLVDILPQKVGSLLSLNSIREDLEVAHKTVSFWMETLERFYYAFRIYPFHHMKIRSLKKEPKVYLWDWSEIENPAALAENMVASHLLKLCHFLADTQGYKTVLSYIRDIEGREVDFIVSEKGRPWFAVEVKSTSEKISKNLLYFAEKMQIPYVYQLVTNEKTDVRQGSVRIISIDKFLSALV